MKYLIGLIVIIAAGFAYLIKSTPTPERLQVPKETACPPCPPPPQPTPLVQLLQPSTLSTLHRQLSDTDPAVRLAAFDLEYHARTGQAVNQLAQILQSETEVGNAAAALRIATSEKDPLALPLAVKALKHYSPDVRLAAVKSLAAYNDPRTLASLAAAQRDPDEAVRKAAAIVIAQIDRSEQQQQAPAAAPAAKQPPAPAAARKR